MSAKLCLAILAAGVAAAMAPAARAQLATLDKGHQLLADMGLQIWGCDTGASSFNYGNLTNANMNAVMWSHGQSKPGVLVAGQKWGKWVDYTGNPATALNATENAHYADLVAIQVGDEQQSDMENPNSLTTSWFQNARNNGHFNDKLLYVNSFFINDDAAYAAFIANANPDAISWDAYPFGTEGIQPINWLGKAQQFRRHALGSFIGANNNSARPYGLYLQAYSSTSEARRDPGDLEMRWQQFAAWTLGYTFVDNFTVGGGTSLFNGGSMSSPNQPRYDQFKETARQSLNLGPALVKLISYSNGAAGGGTSIVRGKNAAGALNPLPISWKDFNRNDAPPDQRYLTSVSAVNLGSKNNGQPGDVYVGFFNPLHASFGPAGSTYFMVTNALGANLQDPTLLVDDCIQRITLDFDFGASGIDSLQRLRRSDGQVEVVPLTFLSGNNYRLTFDLEGGTGDLFKYNDGTPFVGVPFTATSMHWDDDASAANNNISTGAGLGGGGNWDSSSSKWYDGAANVPWAAGNEAVFGGAAGTVTLASPQAATSLRFKTNGYTVAGSTLTMSGPTVAVDAGVTATISSVVAGAAGLVKNGAGTLNLAVNNSYSGGTTINGGVLGIVSGSLGANPASPAVNVVINNGATLRFNQNNLTLTAQRRIALGAGGGVIDTAVNNGVNGVISGSTLTKTGVGTLTLSAANTHAATAINGGAIVVSSDENLGAVPGSFAAGNLTLDGGTLRFGANMDISSNRGITLGAGGGTIDTQGFSNLAGYTQHNGISGGGNLTKLGNGTFFMNTAPNQLNTGWTGNLVLKEGAWKITERGGLPANPSTSGPVLAEQITFDGGTLQIASTVPTVTNGRRGMTVTAGGGTIEIDARPSAFGWAGPLAGNVTSAVLTKTGSGTLQFNTNAVPAPSTYAGQVHVAEGTLVINGGAAMGDLAAVNLADVASVQLTISGATETIGSLSGGGANSGNVTLNASLVTGGNNNSTIFNGLVNGAGGLTKTGSGVFTLAPLAGGNIYAGGTTVTDGTLLVMNTTGSGTGSGPVVVHAGATLGGAGAIQGNVANSGAVAPGGGIGALHIGGDYTQAAGAILEIQVGAAGADKLSVAGALLLAGKLAVSLAPGYAPTGGEQFDVLDWSGALSNWFTNVELGPLPNGLRWDDSQLAAEGVLSIETNFAAADFDRDGHVDGDDLAYWAAGFGKQGTAERGDGDADGDQDVDGADFLLWQRQVGGGPSATRAATEIPEPSTVTLLIMAAAGVRWGGCCLARQWPRAR